VFSSRVGIIVNAAVYLPLQYLFPSLLIALDQLIEQPQHGFDHVMEEGNDEISHLFTLFNLSSISFEVLVIESPPSAVQRNSWGILFPTRSIVSITSSNGITAS
jgi:hypothetical protein